MRLGTSYRRYDRNMRLRNRKYIRLIRIAEKTVITWDPELKNYVPGINSRFWIILVPVGYVWKATPTSAQALSYQFWQTTIPNTKPSPGGRSSGHRAR